MRSSGSPGSWPPSAAEFRCVSLTLRSHPKTSNLFPEFDSMLMAAKWTFLTSHAARQTRASTRRSRRAVSICSLIVTRPSGQPRSGNWTL
jgi:hypothetical protein